MALCRCIETPAEANEFLLPPAEVGSLSGKSAVGRSVPTKENSENSMLGKVHAVWIARLLTCSTHPDASCVKTIQTSSDDPTVKTFRQLRRIKVFGNNYDMNKYEAGFAYFEPCEPG